MLRANGDSVRVYESARYDCADQLVGVAVFYGLIEADVAQLAADVIAQGMAGSE